MLAAAASEVAVTAAAAKVKVSIAAAAKVGVAAIIEDVVADATKTEVATDESGSATDADETAGVEADVTSETGAAEVITSKVEGNKRDVEVSPSFLGLLLALIGSYWLFSFECKKPGILHHFTFGFAHGEAVLPSLGRINGIAPRPLWFFIWISAVVFWEVSAKALKVLVLTS